MTPEQLWKLAQEFTSAKRVVTDWMNSQTTLVQAPMAPGWRAYQDAETAFFAALESIPLKNTDGAE